LENLISSLLQPIREEIYRILVIGFSLEMLFIFIPGNSLSLKGLPFD
jgi:hypothetical protein